jgi:predicted transcriptional regulator
MYTTIKVSQELKQKLDSMKVVDSESYEDILEDLVEDRLALNKEFAKSLEVAREEIKKGGFVTFENLKRRMRNKKSTD